MTDFKTRLEQEVQSHMAAVAAQRAEDEKRKEAARRRDDRCGQIFDRVFAPLHEDLKATAEVLQRYGTPSMNGYLSLYFQGSPFFYIERNGSTVTVFVNSRTRPFTIVPEVNGVVDEKNFGIDITELHDDLVQATKKAVDGYNP